MIRENLVSGLHEVFRLFTQRQVYIISFRVNIVRAGPRGIERVITTHKLFHFHYSILCNIDFDFQRLRGMTVFNALSSRINVISKDNQFKLNLTSLVIWFLTKRFSFIPSSLDYSTKLMTNMTISQQPSTLQKSGCFLSPCFPSGQVSSPGEVIWQTVARF